jgi:hypothetical protein
LSVAENAGKERVRAVLEDQLRIEGLIALPSGVCFRIITSMLGVFVHEETSGRVVVNLRGWLAHDVPLSPRLYEHIALQGGNWLYGHLVVRPDQNGTTGKVTLEHAFAEAHMTDELLADAVLAMGGTLEEQNDQIVALFGGRCKYDDV